MNSTLCPLALVQRERWGDPLASWWQIPAPLVPRAAAALAQPLRGAGITSVLGLVLLAGYPM